MMMHGLANVKLIKKLLNLIRPLFCYIQTLVAIYEKITEDPFKVYVKYGFY
jgi:hypothetical protein